MPLPIATATVAATPLKRVSTDSPTFRMLALCGRSSRRVSSTARTLTRRSCDQLPGVNTTHAGDMATWFAGTDANSTRTFAAG